MLIFNLHKFLFVYYLKRAGPFQMPRSLVSDLGLHYNFNYVIRGARLQLGKCAKLVHVSGYTDQSRSRGCQGHSHYLENDWQNHLSKSSVIPRCQGPSKVLFNNQAVKSLYLVKEIDVSSLLKWYNVTDIMYIFTVLFLVNFGFHRFILI